MFHIERQGQRRSTFGVDAAAVAIALAIALAVPGHVGAAQQPAASQKPAVDIMLMSKPSPPKMGPNTIEVMLKDAAGKPITDADVSVMFFMAAMPEMKMPEMKNSAALKHVKDGTYSGTAQVMMAGKWDVTVTAKRAGKEIGSKKFPITAEK
ncbi:MAG TPA: FixH family protein [Vicinamibacterales bacterium]|nr:FixH family protein [Vicinamibacterales bacterium]